ncbi:hypothetical protein JCM11641_006177 [Rhodosporidiobolus odoratus]
MAHLDTVPVNPATLSEWNYEPWSGHYDGSYLWGRGSADTKNTVVGLFEAVTFLLEADFRPCLTEKGFLNANLTLHLRGTVSLRLLVFSTGYKLCFLDYPRPLFNPPAHFGIAIISLVAAEPSVTLSSHLSRSRPLNLPCSAAGAHARQQLAEVFAKLGLLHRFTVPTSQALDVISGGVKVNASPEITSLIVNYRVSIDSSNDEVKEHIIKLVKPLAQDFDLHLDAFGESTSFGSGHGGRLEISASTDEPAAFISSTRDNPVWDTFAGRIKHSFDHRFPQTPLIVSPSLMLGNTDTRWYSRLNVSRNVYRFSPNDRSKTYGQHTVDERLQFDERPHCIWFYHELIRNADEADW